MQINHDRPPRYWLRILFLEHSFVFSKTAFSKTAPSRRNMQNETTGQVAAGEAARAAPVIS
jgi:hypothetical protein